MNDIALNIRIMNIEFCKIFFVIFLISTIEGRSQCASSSSIFSFSYDGKDYEVVSEMKTWDSAAACAVERGGYLVEINDQNEQTAIFNAIINAGVSPTYTSIPNGGGIAYLWIGATDNSTEGLWQWDGNNDNGGINFWNSQGQNGSGNGSPVGSLYHNWGGKSTSFVNEPDNFGSGQDYAAMGLTGWPSGTTMLGVAGEWNDIIGFNLLYFVIEKDITSSSHLDVNQTMLNLFPNPCSNSISIEGIKPSEGFYYEIFSITGKLLSGSSLINTTIINTENLQQGMYFLRIQYSNKIETLKFIKS
jgi:hypothetical protein